MRRYICLALWLAGVSVGCRKTDDKHPAPVPAQLAVAKKPEVNVQLVVAKKPEAKPALNAAPEEDIPTGKPPVETQTRQIFWPFTTAADRERNVPPRGGLIPASVEVGPNSSQSVRLSIQEHGIDSIGQQLRASLWMASFLAASNLELPLTCCTFSVVPGSIDGVYRMDGYSAGAATTAAMMAALFNQKVRPEVTMTGTVNPDGSVGPVGGLRMKLFAAVRENKKFFGVPAGQYYEPDPKNGRLEDLHELATKHSIILVEIKDINDAYNLLTGRVIKPSVPLTIDQMETNLDWMKERAEIWQRQALDVLRPLEHRLRDVGADDARQYLRNEIQWYERFSQHIDELSRSKVYAQAYAEAMRFFVWASGLQRMEEKLRDKKEGDVLGLMDTLVPSLNAAQQTWAATVQEFEVRLPSTISEAIELIDIYAYAMSGWARLKAVSDEATKYNNHKIGSNDLEQVRLFLTVISQAEAIFDVASQEQRNRGHGLPAPKKKVEFNEEAMHHLAQAYTSAARANQKYYEEEVRRQDANWLRLYDLVGDPTRTCRDVLSYAIQHENESGIHSALASLGASINAYSCVAASLATLQSGFLGYKYDKEEKKLVAEITDKRAFTEMLMLADNKARELANMAAMVTGEGVPLSARSWYATARMMRESEKQQEKIDALQRFWDSSTRSRLAVLILRTALKSITPVKVRKEP